jgi:UDP-N-acetyl-D-mannosaminuronic acid dehydrogenase
VGNIDHLRRAIETKQARMGVVGLGYVGLPVACLFAKTRFDVVGVDVKPERVAKINVGSSPIEGDEPGLADMLAEVVSGGRLRATTSYQDLSDRDAITISVETPVGEDHVPRFEALRSVLKQMGPVLKDGALVIVESTIAPGTMGGLVKPLLEESSGKRVNEEFFLGHCPERVMPGKLLANLRGLSRVCGGETAETAETMVALYRHIVEADLDPADCVTAELVKTAENAYRDVNIAFANEVALICEALGGDVWKVRELVNKSPGRHMLLPGAGVGGHCIPKDPWLLIANAGSVGPRLVPASRAVNDGMPLHVAELVVQALRNVGVNAAEAKVAVLGYAYLENSDDTRNSPSQALVARLQEMGCRVVIHDPFVGEHQGEVDEIVGGSDVVVVMVAHDVYRDLDLMRLRQRVSHPILVDGRRVFAAEQVREAGWVYRGVGVA